MMIWWPFKRKTIEERAMEQLSTIAPTTPATLDWDEREDTTDVVQLAIVAAEETSSEARDTLNASTRSLRQNAKTTRNTLTGSMQIDVAELQRQVQLRKAEG